MPQEVLPENSFKDRLAEIVKEAGSAERLARAAGVSGRVIGKYSSGETLPGLDNLLKIAAAAKVSVEWLATGEGPMRRDEAMGGIREADTVWRSGAASADLDLDEYVLVPRYAIEVSAGGGSLVENDMQPFESMAFRRNWVKRMGLDVNRLAVVTTRGDSMEPTLSDGDIVLVDMRQTTIVDGAIHVLRNNGDVLVKRLQRGFGDQVIVRSDNRIYRELEAAVDELNVVGRVVWRGGRM